MRALAFLAFVAAAAALFARPSQVAVLGRRVPRASVLPAPNWLQ